MAVLCLARYAFAAAVCAALLAGCGGSQAPVEAPGDMPAATSAYRQPQHSFARHVAKSATEQVIYSFKGPPHDAWLPSSSLISVSGLLYGATESGGDTDINCGSNGCGAIFDVSTSGKEQLLYDFQGVPDGDNPEGGLASLNGTLYGTTSEGGTTAPPGDGTVFALSASDDEQVLHSFTGAPKDGEFPTGGMVALNGMFYGASVLGGKQNKGIVFEVSPAGTEKVLHSFKGGLDGEWPQGGLLALNGMLYGATEVGGTKSVCVNTYIPSTGCGTIFEINPSSGAESIVYRFKYGSDGASPASGLIEVNGTLYGTTPTGGGFKSCTGSGCGYGTIYSLSTSGKEEVLYRFQSTPDGAEPIGSLASIGDTLYGTTISAGSHGYGTVFEISTSGTGYQIVHNFKAGSDGAMPEVGLLALNSVLYGTTYAGGNRTCDCGTVFQLTP